MPPHSHSTYISSRRPPRPTLPPLYLLLRLQKPNDYVTKLLLAYSPSNKLLQPWRTWALPLTTRTLGIATRMISLWTTNIRTGLRVEEAAKATKREKPQTATLAHTDSNLAKRFRMRVAVPPTWRISTKHGKKINLLGGSILRWQ